MGLHTLRTAEYWSMLSCRSLRSVLIRKLLRGAEKAGVNFLGRVESDLRLW